MGVAGSGKTTVGRRLAERIGCPFYDGDDFHSAGNRAKMAAGKPLSEQDRAGWIADLSRSVRFWNREGPLTVLACSALRRKHRELLAGEGGVLWVYLKISPDLAAKRLLERRGHFFHPALLASQFDTLEAPEGAWVVDVSRNVDTIVGELEKKLRDANVLR